MAILLVAALVLVLSQIDLPQWQLDRVTPVSADAGVEQPETAFVQAAVGGSPLQEGGVLLRAPVPFTEIPERPRLEVITYTVQVEDTVLGIAEQFGLNPNTIVWANHEVADNPFVMAVGQVLFIMPVDGVYHRVKEGDTIRDIAKEYKVESANIVDFETNGFESASVPLTVGEYVIVPDGDRTPPEPPAAPRAPAAPWRNQDFVWPAYGRLTQYFWLPAHPAIDIGAPLGSVTLAGDAGRVVAAGWSDVGYGNYVIISHPDGFRTLYAHLHRIDVSSGQEVARGQQIGTVGNTGRSTGPHLHFEVSLNGRSYNPLLYLP